MNNDEIRALLRDLSQKADAAGKVKSQTVRITFDPEPDEDAQEEAVHTSRQKTGKDSQADRSAQDGKSLQESKSTKDSRSGQGDRSVQGSPDTETADAGRAAESGGKAKEGRGIKLLPWVSADVRRREEEEYEREYGEGYGEDSRKASEVSSLSGPVQEEVLADTGMISILPERREQETTASSRITDAGPAGSDQPDIQDYDSRVTAEEQPETGNAPERGSSGRSASSSESRRERADGSGSAAGQRKTPRRVRKNKSKGNQRKTSLFAEAQSFEEDEPDFRGTGALQLGPDLIGMLVGKIRKLLTPDHEAAARAAEKQSEKKRNKNAAAGQPEEGKTEKPVSGTASPAETWSDIQGETAVSEGTDRTMSARTAASETGLSASAQAAFEIASETATGAALETGSETAPETAAKTASEAGSETAGTASEAGSEAAGTVSEAGSEAAGAAETGSKTMVADGLGADQSETAKALTASEAAQASKAAEAFSKTPSKNGTTYRALRLWLTYKRLIIFSIIAVVVIAVVITAILLADRQRRKKHVIAVDDGLKIAVDREPKEWCTRGEVALGIRAGSPVTAVTVNDRTVNFTGTSTVQAAFEADSSLLDVVVTTKEQELHATVGIPKIDSESPTVTVSSDEAGRAVLTAADEESGVEGIWYGPLIGLSDIPEYQEYTEPVETDGKTLYCYFAEDKAGNVSPVGRTNFERAENISFARENVLLFPGESARLQLEITPRNGYVNDLSWACSDDSVLRLDGDGSVTALTEGTAVVEVSGDNVATARCMVTVRSEVEITISATGDVTMGEDESFNPETSFSTVASMQGYSYFFRNVLPIFEKDDITFVNLEGTLTDRGERRQDRTYCFRGSPEFTQILTDGSVEVATLANNHTLDYGETGLSDTMEHLEEADIEYCIESKIAYMDVDGIRVAMIGIHQLDTGTTKEEMVREAIAEARKDGAKIVVVAFHWGIEGESQPTQDQVTLAHSAIDNGADLVLGHHPHVLQGIEKYAGKYICYSLANFCFGGNSNPSDMDTMIFQQTFRVSGSGSAEDGGVKVIPCSISSVADWNNYQPTPAQGEAAARIMDRINELCKQFGTSFPYEGE